MKFKGLVMNGGAIHGLMHLGAIDCLLKNGYNFNYFAGTSAGSIVCALIANELSVDFILDMSKKHNIIDKSDINIMRLFEDFGIDDGRTFKSFLTKCINNITFEELYKKNNKLLIITAYNIDTQRTEYFNKDTTPDLSIVDAICMSCALPFWMTLKRYNDCRYVDGSIEDDIPFKALSAYIPYEEILGIVIYRPSLKRKINNIVDFMLDVICKNIQSKVVLPIICIMLDIEHIDIFDMYNYRKYIKCLYDKGYTCTDTWIQSHGLFE